MPLFLIPRFLGKCTFTSIMDRGDILGWKMQNVKETAATKRRRFYIINVMSSTWSWYQCTDDIKSPPDIRVGMMHRCLLKSVTQDL